MSIDLIKELNQYGAPNSGTFLLNADDPNSLNYIDLLNPSEPSFIDGVVVHDGYSILYFLDASNLATDYKKRNEIIEKARGILACRGETAVLAAIEPGQITLYPCNYFESDDAGKVIKDNNNNARTLIGDMIEGCLPTTLASYLYKSSRKNNFTVHDLLFNLLKRVGHELNSTQSLKGKHEVILALVGRALLARFLLDRKIITRNTFPELYEFDDPENCFNSAKKATLINHWMDKTFNGEFLPLPVVKNKYESWFKTLDDSVFTKLSYILYHSDEHGQLSLPDFVNFSHVPVGLLSEVYERYAHENLDKDVQDKAKKESIHYTPRYIAEFMLDQSFDAIETSEKHEAKVLDPSCGAGVFIILAFKKLILERWKATGIRPDTKKIRGIMYSQLTGMDINKASLNLTALGLYLSSLELDPKPFPTSKLKFNKNLIGSVLHLTRKENEPWPEFSIVMGSLDLDDDKKYTHKYDLVIGNPPWSKFPTEMRDKLTNVIKSVAANRDPELLIDVVNEHKNPEQVPDLPFVWKSMEWAKPKATIAFALHARFLFKTERIGATSRVHLFKALNVTGILNASAIRQTKVWRGIDAQFCLLFANNTIPTKNNYFNYISPKLDKVLNNQMERMRIDYLDAIPIQAVVLENHPYLLKTLFRGNPLDVDIIKRIKHLSTSENAKPLKEYWETEVGKNRHGRGYAVLGKKKSAKEILKLKPLNLTKSDDVRYIINPKELNEFTHKTLYRPVQPTVFETPLVLVNKAIGANKNIISVRLARKGRAIAYNESFIGFSAAGHSNSKLITEYLFLLLSSDLFLYYLLMVSPEYGVEREAIRKADVDTFPIFPIKALNEKQIKEIPEIIKAFNSEPNWNRLNKFVCELYGLNKYDREVIKDSLQISLPIAASHKRASSMPTTNEIQLFCKTLIESMKPLDVEVSSSEKISTAWISFSIIRTNKNTHSPLDLFQKVLESTTEQATTRIKYVDNNTIHIAMIAQYRYWTPSRARLLAIELTQEYSELFN